MDTSRIGTTEPTLLLTRGADKLLSLKPGEVVRARVVDVLPNGDVSLRIKGSLFEARSAVPLPRDASVLFRVLGRKMDEGGLEMRLQFVEVTGDPETVGLPRESMIGEVQTLARELAANLSGTHPSSDDLATTIERILKALPDDAALLPKDIRAQLHSLLQTSIRSAGQSIQDRVAKLINDLLMQDLPEWRGLVDMQDRLFAHMDGVLNVPLKSVLENTGVALEARLAALAEAIPEPPETASSTPAQESPVAQFPEIEHLRADLKARLMQIKQSILERQGQPSRNGVSSRVADTGRPGEAKPAPERVLQIVDGLLRDIETFQLLSKLTSSFYTFLPVIWEGLKEAEIAFKRSGGSQRGKSHYCLMNLDFEHLGKLTIVAMMQDRDIFVSFKTDHAAFRSVLDKNINELKQMFRDQGFKLEAASFVGKGEDHLAPFERLESFEHIVSIKV